MSEIIDTKNGREKDGQETTPEITHECGVQILLKLSGGGLGIKSISVDDGMLRECTPDDFLTLTAMASTHVQGNLIAAKTINLLLQTQASQANLKTMRVDPLRGPRR